MMQDQSVEASFTISENEYVSANKLFTKLSIKTLFIYGLVGAAFAVIALVTESPVLRIGALGAIVGGFIGDLCVRKIFAPMQTKKQYREYKAIQEPVRITTEHSGIKFEAAIGDAMIEWNRIVKWRESDNFLLIYQAPQVYHIVPKRIGVLADELSKSLVKNVGPAS